MGVRDRIRSQLWYKILGGDQIKTRWPPAVVKFEGNPIKKILKKHWIQKATSCLTMIVHLGIGICCATIWEYAVGDKNKRSTNGRIVYAMVHPCLYLIQIVTE